MGTLLAWTLLAQDPQWAGLRLLSLCDRVVEAACAIEPHLLEAAEHQTSGIPLPIPSESSPIILESLLPSSSSHRCRW